MDSTLREFTRLTSHGHPTPMREHQSAKCVSRAYSYTANRTHRERLYGGSLFNDQINNDTMMKLSVLQSQSSRPNNNKLGLGLIKTWLGLGTSLVFLFNSTVIMKFC